MRIIPGTNLNILPNNLESTKFSMNYFDESLLNAFRYPFHSDTPPPPTLTKSLPKLYFVTQ